jgi:hypothetical protein
MGIRSLTLGNWDNSHAKSKPHVLYEVAHLKPLNDNSKMNKLNCHLQKQMHAAATDLCLQSVIFLKRLRLKKSKSRA